MGQLDRRDTDVVVVFETGPKGDPGPRGEKGADSDVQGPQGVQGVPGDVGGQGIQGPQGLDAYQTWLTAGYVGSIDDFYATQSQDFHFTQYAPDWVWTITHPRLNPKPQVRVFDSTGQETEGDIEYTSAHTLTITFTMPLAGEAFLN